MSKLEGVQVTHFSLKYRLFVKMVKADKQEDMVRVGGGGWREEGDGGKVYFRVIRGIGHFHLIETMKRIK